MSQNGVNNTNHNSNNNNNNNNHHNSSQKPRPSTDSTASSSSHSRHSSSGGHSHGHGHHGHHHSSSSSSGKRDSTSASLPGSSQSHKRASTSSSSGSDYACQLRLSNKLADTPFDPKFLVIPSDFNKFVHYKTTSLEKNYKYPLLTEPNLGIPIELIDPEVYNIPKTKVAVPEEDQPLLRSLDEQDAELRRAPINRGSALLRPAVSWLRKTEYLSSHDNQMGRPVKRASESNAPTSTQSPYQQQQQQDAADIVLVENTFDAINNTNFVHPTNPSLKPVSILPVFPDFDLWANDYTETVFDADPLELPPDNMRGEKFHEYIQEQAYIRSKGIIKGITDKFVYYIAPKNRVEDKNNNNNNNNSSSLDDDLEDDQHPYKMYKVFTSDIFQAQEENYFMVIKDDGVYYNRLPTKVNLKRVKSRDDKILEKKTIGRPEFVTYESREMTRQEIDQKEESISNLIKEDRSMFASMKK
ncbi:RNA polymerase II-associated factor 1 [Heterostelium album PN500]|uniref:RNA polymerase II-associated factor 1 n=1 Tax=Heterostelium pallidum (strain ATCC 26659 / Pp 5 / PN500) TaxID=670386 RepID=D3BHC4_HETP5|nr:RNA polymerase II-associated factor 1 [Heterostelium album PN500]EFA79101.1 RNA polymerase II-associated factor 1 [Heterostelium album PN500]|eukprot:XP_020431223.1 RNA polymerase II-associated factor 1 [Heterostelium album PN500]